MKPRLSRAAQKELHDNARLLRIWRQYHRELLEQALAGPHGAIVAEVVAFLRDETTLDSAPRLLELLRRHDWHLVDADARFAVLHEVNDASARLRERNDLPPFDDSLPGQRPTLFEVVRALLDPTSCPEQDPGTRSRSQTERTSHEYQR